MSVIVNSLLYCIIALGAVVGFGAAIVYFSETQHRKMRTLAEAMTAAELDEIYSLVESIGNERARGFVAVGPKVKANAGIFAVKLPKIERDFPWGDRLIEASVDKPVSFRFVPSNQASAILNPRLVSIPVVKGNQGKRSTNVFSIERYLSLAPELKTKLPVSELADQVALLQILMSNDWNRPSDQPSDQIRIGLNPGWLQSAQFEKCSICSRSLKLILQLPGRVFGGRLAEGSFYFLGCPSHPDQTATLQDWG